MRDVLILFKAVSDTQAVACFLRRTDPDMPVPASARTAEIQPHFRNSYRSVLRNVRYFIGHSFMIIDIIVIFSYWRASKIRIDLVPREIASLAAT